MLEKITVGVVPSAVARGTRMTDFILREIETHIQDAASGVYGTRSTFIRSPMQDGVHALQFGYGPITVLYEIKEQNGEVQAMVGIEGKKLDPRETGTVIRAILAGHEIHEKDGDAHAEHTTAEGTVQGRKALEPFHVRVTQAVAYKDGGYKFVDLGDRTATR